MKKRDLQNENLDRIGRRLLAVATRASDEELDRIVASPQLFDAVKARIKAERREPEQSSRTFFGDWRGLLVWNQRKIGASLAVLMFLSLLGAFGLIVLTKQDSSPTVVEKTALPPVKLPAAPVHLPQPVENPETPPQIVKTKVGESKNRVIFQKAVFKTEKRALPKQMPRRKNPVKRETEIAPEGEFYALNYAVRPGEAGENLRIVRAELSRASLFALGVNLPIENESEKIKTDLLVGADGVAKAIRFVK